MPRTACWKAPASLPLRVRARSWSCLLPVDVAPSFQIGGAATTPVNKFTADPAAVAAGLPSTFASCTASAFHSALPRCVIAGVYAGAKKRTAIHHRLFQRRCQWVLGYFPQVFAVF